MKFPVSFLRPLLLASTPGHQKSSYPQHGRRRNKLEVECPKRTSLPLPPCPWLVRPVCLSKSFEVPLTNCIGHHQVRV